VKRKSNKTLGILPLAGLPLLLLLGAGTAGTWWGLKKLNIGLGSALENLGKGLRAGGPWIAGAVATRFISKYAMPEKFRPVGWIVTGGLAGYGTYKLFKPGPTLTAQQVEYFHKYFTPGAMLPQTMYPVTSLEGKLARGFSAIPEARFISENNKYRFMLHLENRMKEKKDIKGAIVAAEIANQKVVITKIMSKPFGMSIPGGKKTSLGYDFDRDKINKLPKTVVFRAFFYSPASLCITPFYVSKTFDLREAKKLGQKTLEEHGIPSDREFIL